MESKFYEDAIDYWAQVPATLEGVLGGFEFISDDDVRGSSSFLEELFCCKESSPPERNIALDCGAGIGRVTKFLLTKYFDKVDLVEQNQQFLEKAHHFIDNPNKIGTMYASGLQNFKPDKKYDIIWNQWVLGHLEDADLIEYFITCQNYLNPNGLIIVKENVTSSNKLEKDEVDSSVTRPMKHLLRIFKKAKLKIVKELKQEDFPKGIYPVYMFALRPSINNSIMTRQSANVDQETSEKIK